MRTTKTLVMAAMFGAGAAAITASHASARIVCNAEGDCWHTKTDYEYRPDFRLTVHPDGWKWNEGERHAWREHEGRGYWQGGAWRDF